MYRQNLPNGQVRYREVSAEGTPGIWVGQEKIAEAIRRKINEYISLHRGVSDVWATRSYHNPLHQDLTDFLKEAKLIGNEDLAYVAGSADMARPKDRGFQIGIGAFEKSRVSREKAWFIWNAFGYDPTAENSGFIQLKKDGETRHFRY
jgi:hypothetical protein